MLSIRHKALNSKQGRQRLPKQNLSREEVRLDEVINKFALASEAKGWAWDIAAKDTKNFRYATVSVRRYSNEEISATFGITCDESVKLTVHQTSFHGYGIRDLRDAAWNEICKLPWLEKSKKEGELKSDWSFSVIERLLRNFHKMARQLKHRYGDRSAFLIEDEYDIQDLLHTFLRGFFDDIRAEEYSPSYAGGSSRLDFLLKKEEIVIESKMASNKLKDRQVGEQLIIDIARYKAHLNCKYLICFVYDPNNNLKNPSGLEADLSKKHDALNVKVIVVSPS
jgi:hypothetical protein